MKFADRIHSGAAASERSKSDPPHTFERASSGRFSSGEGGSSRFGAQNTFPSRESSIWPSSRPAQPERAARPLPVTTGHGLMLQRACACGGECESCKKKKLQRRAAGPGPDTIPESVHRTIGRSGSPLPRATRGMFEAVLGHDFSGVRVHADAASAASAHDVNARAYTVGQNIVFGSGEYRPGTAAGDHLLAHELTHVVQQSGSGGTLQRQGFDDREEDEKEREAESVADRATSLHDSEPDKEIAGSRTGAERLDPAPPPDDYEVHAKVVQIPDPGSDEWGMARACILQLHGDEIQSMAAALNLALTRRVNLTMIVRDPAEYMEMAKGRFGNWKDSLRYIAVGPKGSMSDTCWADANRMFPDNEGSNELTTAKLFYGRKPCSPKAQDKLKEFRNKVTEALGNCTNSRKAGTAENQDVEERLPVLSMHNNGLGSGDVSFGGWKNSAMTDVAYAGGRGFGGNMRSGDDDIVLVTSAATYESFSGLLILESAERCMPAGEPDRLFPGFSDLLNKKRSSRDRRLASVFDPTLSAPKSPVQETDSDAEITLIHEVARGLVAGLDTGRYDTQVPNPADRARIVANVRGADEVVGRFNVVLQSIFKSDIPTDQSPRKNNPFSGSIGRTTLPKDGSSSVTYRRTNFLNLEIGSDKANVGPEDASFRKNLVFARTTLSLLHVSDRGGLNEVILKQIKEIEKLYVDPSNRRGSARPGKPMLPDISSMH